MCGILGWLNRGGGTSPSPEALDQGLAMLRHRGPDNTGTYRSEDLHLGHTRLSILDLSDAGNQPFVRGDHALVYNGEVYNFRELRAELQALGRKFTTDCDTEVVLEACREFGVHDAARRFQGMFAFAFADLRRREVALVRDRLGIKPLVWVEGSSSYAWASEAKALRPLVGLRVDPLRALWSASGSTAETSFDYTPFAGVRHVPPGTVVLLSDARGPATTTYYDVMDDIDEREYRRLERASLAEVVDELDGLLLASVRATLVSDVPVGLFLSGGVDSGLLLGATKGVGANVEAFSSDVTGGISEAGAARSTAETVGAKLTLDVFKPASLLERLPEVTWHYDAPIVTHTNSLAFASLARTARAGGVKPVLTGEGADEMFLGYSTDALRRAEPYLLAPAKLLERLYRMVDPRLAAWVMKSGGGGGGVGPLFDAYGSSSRQARAAERYEFVKPRARSAQAATVRLLTSHLLGLLHRNDRMGMAASIESRFPFLSDDIVRFSVNLPTRHKIAIQRRFYDRRHPFIMDKAPIRLLANKYVSADLAFRKKTGFPHYGFRQLRVLEPGFFAGGYLEGVLDIKNLESVVLENSDIYTLGKLAAVETFGLVHDRQVALDDVAAALTRHFDIVDPVPVLAA